MENEEVVREAVEGSEVLAPGGKKNKITGMITRAYWIIPAAGTLLLGALTLLSLIAPVMTHAGYNVASTGFAQIFSVKVDYAVTGVCAILAIMSVYILLLGAARLRAAYASPYGKIKKKGEYVADGVMCLAILIVGAAGCSQAGKWYGDAGAGFSLCVADGIIGLVLLAARVFFEAKLFDAQEAERKAIEIRAKHNDSMPLNSKKKSGPIARLTAMVTVLLVIAFVVGMLITTIAKNPFNLSAVKKADTRDGVISAFGIPEGSERDSSSFMYYSHEYANIEAMIDALEEKEESEFEDSFEDLDSEDDLDDLEDALGGVMGLEGIIDNLKEKKDSVEYKTTTICFGSSSEGKENEVVSFICVANMPRDYEGEKPERTLKNLEVISADITQYTGIATIEYIAEYNDGSFIKNSVEVATNVEVIDGSELPVNVQFSDSLGKYSVEVNDIVTSEYKYYVKDNTLYVMQDLSSYDMKLSESEIQSIRKIVINENVDKIYSEAFSQFVNVSEIELPDKDINVSRKMFENTAFFKDRTNWENGVLYLGNVLLAADSDAAIGDYTVKEGTKYIAAYAFENAVGLTGITIPEGVSVIGSDAFDGCNELVYAELPEGLTKINSYAFSDCSKLQKVNIPSGVTAIEDRAFLRCSNLETVFIPDSVETLGYNVFYGTINITIYCSSAEVKENWDQDIKDYTLVMNVKEISVGNKDFDYYVSNDDRITIVGYNGKDGEVKLPSEINGSEVVAIGDKAFRYNNYITGLVIPEGVTSIGNYAFYECEYLTSVTLPSTLTSMGDNCFNRCTVLEGIEIPSGIKKLGTGVFSLCSGLTYAVLPETIEEIGENAFVGANELATINIPSGVKSIGKRAFSGCSSLTDIQLHEGLESIGDYAFYDCAVSRLIIPSTVSVVGQEILTSDDAVVFCKVAAASSGWSENWFKKQNQIVWNVKEYVETDENYSYCTLQDDGVVITEYKGAESVVNIPAELDGKEVREIAYKAFYENTAVTEVVIPQGVKKVGAYAFYGCSAMTSAELPSTLEYLGDYAFNHANLYEIIVPASVGHVGEYALSYLASDATIYCKMQAEPEGWGYYWCGSYPVVWNFGSMAEQPAGDYEYFIRNDNTVGLKSYSGTDTEIVIPAEIDGMPVAYIGNSLYSNQPITAVTIPASVKYIENNVFYECTSLAEATYLGDISDWLEIKFVDQYSTPLKYATEFYMNGTPFRDIAVPAGTKQIGAYAFYGASMATSLTLPEGLETIGDYAFDGCRSLTGALVLPGSLKTIGDYAFLDCSSIDSVDIGIGLEVSGYSAFNACTGIKEVRYAGELEDWCRIGFDWLSNPVNYSECLYLNGKLLEGEVVLPSGITKVGSNLFEGCVSITSVMIPEGVTEIEKQAFDGCKNLKKIYIPDTVTEIGTWAFDNCDSLKIIFIPDSVLKIGAWAFEVPDDGTIYVGGYMKSGWDDRWNLYSDADIVTHATREQAEQAWEESQTE